MIKSWGAALAFLALLCLVGFALSLDLSAPSYHRQNAANHSGQAFDNHHHTDDYMATAFAVGKFVDDHNGAVSAVATIFLVIFTFVLASKTSGLHVATRGLQDFARIQAEDMKNSIAQASRAAKAMEIMSDTLSQNTQITKDIIERQKKYAAIQLRAYVYPWDAGLYEGSLLDPPQTARTNEPGVVFNIRNSGHTPAKNVISWGNLTIIETSNELSLIVPPLELTFPTTLSPGGVMPKVSWLQRPLTADEIKDVQTGTRGIYYYGRIEYFDCFGDHRFSNFRLRYTGIFPPFRPNGTFTHCQEGNESD